MAAFDFPNSPSVNDTYSANGMTFTWNGTMWKRTSPSVGAQGSTGPTGAQGAAGAQGATGPTGPTGAQGATGATGSQGATGATGSQGATGSTGAQGATAAQGAQGATGPTGAQGAQGHQGATGSTGSQGAAGSATISNNADNRVITGGSGTNLNGEANLTFDGNDLTISRYLYAKDIFIGDVSPELRFTDSDENPDYRIRLNAGQLGIRDITNTQDKLIFNTNGMKIVHGLEDKDGDLGSSGQVLSSTGSQVNWVDANSGPTGPTGPTGAQGATGPSGSTGPTGSQGATGPTGAQGATGATGAQGATAAQGAQGATGSTGAQGATGSTGAQGSLATINSNTDNFVLTGTGTANTIQGETNLRFDGSTLLINKSSTSDYGRFEVKGPTADDILTSDIRTKTVATFSGTTPGTTAAGKGAGIVIKPIADRGCNYFFGVANSSTNQEAQGSFVIRSGNFASSTVERLRIDSSGHILPGSDGSQNLGSSSLRWANLYVNDLKLSNKGSKNDVDGTWGDWTLQEGESDVYMINNRSGKKFKIKMEEVE